MNKRITEGIIVYIIAITTGVSAGFIVLFSSQSLVVGIFVTMITTFSVSYLISYYRTHKSTTETLKKLYELSEELKKNNNSVINNDTQWRK
ncbi:MAG: hypothetical protein HYW78_01685 [Parcubacteria group bacterium]|nr:hypothetical protein [Parcubacteria group bacterium]